MGKGPYMNSSSQVVAQQSEPVVLTEEPLPSGFRV